MNVISHLKTQHISILVSMVFEPLDVIKSQYTYTFPIKKFYQEARMFLSVAAGVDYEAKPTEEKVEAALRYMAYRLNKNIEQIESEMQEIISDLILETPELYKRITPDKAIPTPRELLAFLYQNYPAPFIILPYGYFQYI